MCRLSKDLEQAAAAAAAAVRSALESIKESTEEMEGEVSLALPDPALPWVAGAPRNLCVPTSLY